MADLNKRHGRPNLLIGIVGFTLLGEVVRRLHQQIGAMKGTVDAQKQTLDTVGELNKWRWRWRGSSTRRSTPTR